MSGGGAGKALRDLGPTEILADRSAEVYDVRHAIRSRGYFQCILAMQDLAKRGSLDGQNEGIRKRGLGANEGVDFSVKPSRFTEKV